MKFQAAALGDAGLSRACLVIPHGRFRDGFGPGRDAPRLVSPVLYERTATQPWPETARSPQGVASEMRACGVAPLALVSSIVSGPRGFAALPLKSG
jgi:hypothetical protein